jgi:hypothetical protein
MRIYSIIDAMGGEHFFSTETDRAARYEEMMKTTLRTITTGGHLTSADLPASAAGYVVTATGFARIMKKTSKELLAAAGYISRVNQYAALCDGCGAAIAAGEGRVVRASGGQNWIPSCRSAKCTAAILHNEGVSIGEAGGNPIETDGE